MTETLSPLWEVFIRARTGLSHRHVGSVHAADAEMALHFNLADLFIMPSEKEGFGIVFIEAMFYGLPVIAGNKDGSVDALCNGELGTIVDPDNLAEISNAIKKILDNPSAYKPDQQKLKAQFSYEWYKRKLYNCLRSTMHIQITPDQRTTPNEQHFN